MASVTGAPPSAAPQNQTWLAYKIGRILEHKRFYEAATYIQVSVVAAFVDIALFSALMFGEFFSVTIAGSLSYLAALVLHYRIATSLVFQPERTGKSRARLLTEYFATGLVGVMMTALVIYSLTTYFGLWGGAAKAAAVAASFFAVYALRSFLVFKENPEIQQAIRQLSEAESGALNALTNYERIRQELASKSHLKVTEGLSIAVLLPCYNEEATIADTIREFQEALPASKIYVYDNNSSDRTSKVAIEAGAVVRHERLQGKGNVVRRMLADIDADIYVMADGDMTYDASAAGYMIQQLVAHNLDMVVGTRIANADGAYRAGHRFGNRLFNVIVQKLFGTQFSDILSGYRVLSRRFAKSFPASSSGFEIETELSVHAMDLRLSTLELPLHYKKRPANSESKLRTYADGARILLTIGRMYRWLKPRQFYGAIGASLAVLSLALGIPVIIDFFMTGLVLRFPTAILAAAFGQLSVLCLMCGLILEAISRGQREIRRMRYLDLPAPATEAAESAKISSHIL